MIDQNRIELLKMRIEILKIKSNDYEWQSYVPKEVKALLDETLIEINETLAKLQERK